MKSLRIKRLNPNVPTPAYATPGAAGFDLCAAIPAPVWLQPGERRHIGTGIAVEIPFGYEGQVRARSGLAAKHGLGMVNGVGTIDCDYRGEVGLLLVNHGRQPVEIKPFMRCGQMVIAPVEQMKIEVVEELAETERSAGGFGSTGT
jgi:dUTP pyrophosphatase